MNGGICIPDKLHVVEGLAPATPSTSTPDYVSLKNALAVEVLVHVKNGTTVTGSAITLKQASAVAGTGEKALAFNWVWVKSDTAAADAPWTKTAVTSNTFTTLTTNSKNAFYRIPVDPASLDLANDFDCLRAGTGDAVNTTVTVLYLMQFKDGAGNATSYPSAIID
jgi:hypothetical protein